MADFTLIGTLSYEELKQIYDSSERLLSQFGWHGNWPSEFRDNIGRRSEMEQSLTPGQFFERLYHLEDCGVFHLETKWSDNIPLRLGLYFHESVQASFQIRASSQLCSSLIDSPLSCWKEIQTLRRAVCSLVEQFQLRPSVDTITFDVVSDIPESSRKFRRLKNSLIALIDNEDCPAETASLIEGEAFIMRFIVDGREQYLIVPFTGLNDLAASQLYYLEIVKGKIKELLTRFNESYKAGLATLKPEIINYLTAEKLDETELKKLLDLRRKIANHTTEFRILENHVDLAIGFLNFNAKSFSTSLNEKPLLPSRPCTVAVERERLQLYYLSPLKTITLRTGKLIKEAGTTASTISEIMMLRANLKAQKYLERLQVAALSFTILSVILIFRTDISSIINSLYHKLSVWFLTIIH